MTQLDVSESKDLTQEDSDLMLKWKGLPAEHLRRVILVGRLQRLLIARNHELQHVDGHYGRHTDDAGQYEADSTRGLRLGPELSRIIREQRARWAASLAPRPAGAAHLAIPPPLHSPAKNPPHLNYAIDAQNSGPEGGDESARQSADWRQDHDL